jgi:hypothetical protein
MTTSVLPLVAHLLLVATSVPNLNVEPSCNGSARGLPANETKSKIERCLNSEYRTRDELRQKWPTYQDADRGFCATSVTGFAPTYTELAVCLDMKAALRNGASRTF